MTSEVDTVFHLAAQAIVGPANAESRRDVRAQHRGHVGDARGVPSRAAACGPIVVASSDKAYGDHGGVAVPRSRCRCSGDTPTTQQDLRRPARADLRPTYGLPVAITRCGNIYGGGDLNWSRIVPGTIRSVLRGRAAGDPIRRTLRARLLLRRGRRRRRRCQLARGGLARRSGRSAAKPSTSRAEERLTVLEIVDRISRLMGSDLEPEVRDEAVNEIPEQRVSARKARDLLGWQPAHSARRGPRRHDRVVPHLPLGARVSTLRMPRMRRGQDLGVGALARQDAARRTRCSPTISSTSPRGGIRSISRSARPARWCRSP